MTWEPVASVTATADGSGAVEVDLPFRQGEDRDIYLIASAAVWNLTLTHRDDARGGSALARWLTPGLWPEAPPLYLDPRPFRLGGYTVRIAGTMAASARLIITAVTPRPEPT